MTNLLTFAMRFCAVTLFLASLAGFGKINTARAQTDILYQTNFGSSLQRTGAGGMNSIFLTGSNNPSTKGNYKGPDEIYDQSTPSNKWKVSYGAVSVWNNLTDLGKCLVVGFHTLGSTEPSDISKYQLDGIKTQCVAYLEMEWDVSNVDGVAFDVYHAWDDGVCAGLYVSVDNGDSWNEAVSVKALPKGELFTIVDNKHYDGPCRFALLVFREASDWNFRQATRLIVTGATIYTNRVRTPEFSPVPGIYKLNTSVSISSATTGATLYYAIDGSTPATEYASPLPFTQKQTAFITAMGTKTGKTNSFTAEGVYFFTNDTNLIKADFNTCTKSEAKKVSVNATGYGYENWGASNAYQADGCVAIGLPSRSNNGTLTTPTLTDKDDDLPYTVEFFAKKVISGTCNLKVGSASAFNLTQNWKYYSYEFTDKSTTVAFASQTGVATAFVDNICIWQNHSPQIWNIPTSTIDMGSVYGEETIDPLTSTTFSIKPKYLTQDATVTFTTSRPDVFTITGLNDGMVLSAATYSGKGSAIPITVSYKGKGNVEQQDYITVTFTSAELNASFTVTATTKACPAPVVNEPISVKQHVISGSFTRAGLSGEKYWWQFKADDGDWKASNRQLTGSTFEEKPLTANTTYHAMLWHECGTAHAYSDTVKLTPVTPPYDQARIIPTDPARDTIKLTWDNPDRYLFKYNVENIALNDDFNESLRSGWVKIKVEGDTNYEDIVTRATQQRLYFSREGTYRITFELYEDQAATRKIPGEPADTTIEVYVDFQPVNALLITPSAGDFVEWEKIVLRQPQQSLGVKIYYKLDDGEYTQYTTGDDGFIIRDNVTVYAFACGYKTDTVKVQRTYRVLHSRISHIDGEPTPVSRYINWGVFAPTQGNSKFADVSFFYQYIRTGDSALSVQITGNRPTTSAQWSVGKSSNDLRPFAGSKYGAITVRNATMYEGKLQVTYNPKLHGFDTAKVLIFNQSARDSFYVCVEGRASLEAEVSNLKTGTDTLTGPDAQIKLTPHLATLAPDMDQVKMTLSGPVSKDNLKTASSPYTISGLTSGNYTFTAQMVHYDGEETLGDPVTITFVVDLPDLRKPSFRQDASEVKCNSETLVINANNSTYDHLFYSTDNGATWITYPTGGIVWSTEGETEFIAMVTRTGYDTAWSDPVTYTVRKTAVRAANKALGTTDLNAINGSVDIKYAYTTEDLHIDIIKQTRDGVFTLQNTLNTTNCADTVSVQIPVTYNASTHGKDTAWIAVYNTETGAADQTTFFVTAETKAKFTWERPSVNSFTDRDTLLVSITPRKVALGDPAADKDYIRMTLSGATLNDPLVWESKPGTATTHCFDDLLTGSYTLKVELLDAKGNVLYEETKTPVTITRKKTVAPVITPTDLIHCEKEDVTITASDPDGTPSIRYATAPAENGPWTWRDYSAPFTLNDRGDVWVKASSHLAHKDSGVSAAAVHYFIPTPSLNEIADIKLDTTYSYRSTPVTLSYSYLNQPLTVEIVKNGRDMAGHAPFSLSGNDINVDAVTGKGTIQVHACETDKSNSFTVTYNSPLHGKDTAVIKVYSTESGVEHEFKIAAETKATLVIRRPNNDEYINDRDSLHIICAVDKAELAEGKDKLRITATGTKGQAPIVREGYGLEYDLMPLITDDYTLKIELLHHHGGEDAEVMDSIIYTFHLTRKKVAAPQFDPVPSASQTYSNELTFELSSTTQGAKIWYASRTDENDEWGAWQLYNPDNKITDNFIGTTYYRAMAEKARMDTSDIVEGFYKVARSEITVQNIDLGATKDSVERTDIEISYAYVTDDLIVEITEQDRGGFTLLKPETEVNLTLESPLKGKIKRSESGTDNVTLGIKYKNDRWGKDSATVCIYNTKDDIRECFKVYGETWARFRFASPTPGENQVVTKEDIEVGFWTVNAHVGERSVVKLNLTGPTAADTRDTVYTDQNPYVNYKSLKTGSYVLTATLVDKNDHKHVLDTTAPRRFTINLPDVAVPVANYANNSVHGDGIDVSFTCATSGAKIRYQKGDKVGTGEWTEYTGSIHLTYDEVSKDPITHTIKAYAYKSGMDDSKDTVYKFTVVRTTFATVGELTREVFDKPAASGRMVSTLNYKVTGTVLLEEKGLTNRRIWVQDYHSEAAANGNPEGEIMLRDYDFTGWSDLGMTTGLKLSNITGRIDVLNGVRRMRLSAKPSGDRSSDSLGLVNTPLYKEDFSQTDLAKRQSEYITVKNVQFVGVENGTTFVEGVNYTFQRQTTYILKSVEDPSKTVRFVALSDLQGQKIELDPVNIRAVVMKKDTSVKETTWWSIATDMIGEIERILKPALEAGSDVVLTPIYNYQTDKNFTLKYKDISTPIAVTLEDATGAFSVELTGETSPAVGTPGSIDAKQKRDWTDVSAKVTYRARSEYKKDTALLIMSWSDGAGLTLKDTVRLVGQTLECAPAPGQWNISATPRSATVIFNGGRRADYRYKFWDVTSGAVQPEPDNYTLYLDHVGSLQYYNTLFPEHTYRVKVSRRCAAAQGSAEAVWSADGDTTFTTLNQERASIAIASPEDDIVITTPEFEVAYEVDKFAVSSTYKPDNISYGYITVKVNGSDSASITDTAVNGYFRDGKFHYTIRVKRSGDYTLRLGLYDKREPAGEVGYDVRTWHVDLPDVEHVVFTPAADTFINAVSGITLSCATEGAKIYYKTTEAGSYALYTNQTFNFTETGTIWAFAEKALMDTVFDTAVYIIVYPEISVEPAETDFGAITSATNPAPKTVTVTYAHLLSEQNLQLSLKSGNERKVFSLTSGIETSSSDTLLSGIVHDKTKHTATLTFTYTPPRYGVDEARYCIFTTPEDAEGGAKACFTLKGETDASLSITVDPAGNRENKEDSINLGFTWVRAIVGNDADNDYIFVEVTGTRDGRTVYAKTFPVRENTLKINDLPSGDYTVRAVLKDKDGNDVVCDGSVVEDEKTFKVEKDDVAKPEFFEPGIHCNGKLISISCATEDAAVYYNINGGDWILYEGEFNWRTLGSTTFRAVAVKAHMDTAWSDEAVYTIEKSYVSIPDVRLDSTKSNTRKDIPVSYSWLNSNLKVEIVDWNRKTDPLMTRPFGLADLETGDTLKIEHLCIDKQNTQFTVTYNAARYGSDTAKISVGNSKTEIDTFFYVFGYTKPTFRIRRPEAGTYTRDSIEVAFRTEKLRLRDGREKVHVVLKGDRQGEIMNTWLDKDNMVMRNDTLFYKMRNLKSDRYTLAATLYDNVGNLVDTTSDRIFTIAKPKVQKPDFAVKSDTLANEVRIELATTTKDAEIYYRVNGGEWTLYEEAFTYTQLGKNVFEAKALKPHMDTSDVVTKTYVLVKTKVWLDGDIDFGSTKDDLSRGVRVHFENLSQDIHVYITGDSRGAFRIAGRSGNYRNDSLIVEHHATGYNYTGFDLYYEPAKYGTDQAVIHLKNAYCDTSFTLKGRMLATFRHAPNTPANESTIPANSHSAEVNFLVKKAVVADGQERVHMVLVSEKEGKIKDTLLRGYPYTLTNLKTGTYRLYDTLQANDGTYVDSTAPRKFYVQLQAVARPSFEMPAGGYSHHVNIKVNCPDAAANLYYTSAPTKNGPWAAWEPFTAAFDRTESGEVYYRAMATREHMDTSYSDTVRYFILQPQLDAPHLVDLGSTKDKITSNAIVFKHKNIEDKSRLNISIFKQTAKAGFTLNAESNVTLHKTDVNSGYYDVDGELPGVDTAQWQSKAFRVDYTSPLYGPDTAWVRLWQQDGAYKIIDDTVLIVARTLTDFRVDRLNPEPKPSSNKDKNYTTAEFVVKKAELDNTEPFSKDRIHLVLRDAKQKEAMDTVFSTTSCRLYGLKTGSYTMTDTLFSAEGLVVDTILYKFSVNLEDIYEPAFVYWSGTAWEDFPDEEKLFGDTVKLDIRCETPGAGLFYRTAAEPVWKPYKEAFVWKEIGRTTFEAMAVKEGMDTSYSSYKPKVRIAKATYNTLAELKEEVYDNNAIESNLTYKVLGNVTVTGVHPNKEWHRFWVQDADRTSGGGMQIINYDEAWNLKVGDVLHGLQGKPHIKMIGAKNLECDDTPYPQQPYYNFTVDGTPVADGTAEPYVETVTWREILYDHKIWQNRLVRVRNVKVINPSGSYSLAHLSYADGIEDHYIYVDAQDNDNLKDQPIEPDSFNVTGLVQIRQLDKNTIWCNGNGYGTLFPRDLDDIERIAQPALMAGSDLTLEGIYENSASGNVTFKSKDIEGNVEAAIVKQTRTGAFTLTAASENVNTLGARVLVPNSYIGINYTFREGYGKDTAWVEFKFGDMRDTLRVFAESRECMAPTQYTVVDSVTVATVSFVSSRAIIYERRFAEAAKDKTYGEVLDAISPISFTEVNFTEETLKAGRTYCYRVRGRCGSTEASYSKWSDTQTFVTRQPTVHIIKPVEGEVYTTAMDMEFQVENMHLSLAPDVPGHLPNGTATMQLDRYMEDSGRWVNVDITSQITNPTNHRVIPSGDYKLRMTLIPNGADKESLQGDSAHFVDRRSYKVRLPQLPRPKFSPAFEEAVYYDSVKVTVTCDEPTAGILYSFDGITYDSLKEGDEIWLKRGTNHIYAKAVKYAHDTAANDVEYDVRGLWRVESLEKLYKEDEPDFYKGVVNPGRDYIITGDMVVTYVDSASAEECFIFVQDKDKTRDAGRSIRMRAPLEHSHLKVAALKTGDVISNVVGSVTAGEGWMCFNLIDSALKVSAEDYPVYVDTIFVSEMAGHNAEAPENLYQSDLVCVKYIHFTSYVANYAVASTVSMADKFGNDFTVSMDFHAADYYVDKDTVPDPSRNLFMTGIMTQIKGGHRFTPRSRTDIVFAPYFYVTPNEVRAEAIYYDSTFLRITQTFGYGPEDIPRVDGKKALKMTGGFLCNFDGSMHQDEYFDQVDEAEGGYRVVWKFKYRHAGEPRFDTMIIAFTYADLHDTVYFYAESRECETPEVYPENISIDAATLNFEVPDPTVRFQIDTCLTDGPWHTTYLTTPNPSYTLEELTPSTTYYYQVRKVCFENSDTVVTGPWAHGSFKTISATAPYLTLKEPVQGQKYEDGNDITFSYTYGNVVMVETATGRTDSVETKVHFEIFKDSITDNKSTRIHEDWTGDKQSYTMFLPTGRYVVRAILVHADSSDLGLVEGQDTVLAAISSRRNFNVQLPKLATPVFTAEGQPCGMGYVFYDSVQLRISCPDGPDSIQYSFNGTDWMNYPLDKDTVLTLKEVYTKVYARAVKARRDPSDTAIEVKIVNTPLTFDSGTLVYNVTCAVDKWPAWNSNDDPNIANLNRNFRNLRDTMFFYMLLGDSLVTLDMNVEQTNTTTQQNNMNRILYSKADGSKYPGLQPGIYHDTLLYIIKKDTVLKIAFNFNITAYHVPKVEISPDDRTRREHEIEVSMDWARKPANKLKGGDYQIYYTLDGSTPTKARIEAGECLLYEGAFKITDSVHADTNYTVKALGYDPWKVDTVDEDRVTTVVYNITNRVQITVEEAPVLNYAISILDSVKETLHYKAKFLTAGVNVYVRPRKGESAVIALDKTYIPKTSQDTSFEVVFKSVDGLYPGEYQDTVVVSTNGRDMCKTVVNITVKRFIVPKVKITPVAGTYDHEVRVKFECENPEHPGYKYEIRYTLFAGDMLPSRTRGFVSTGDTLLVLPYDMDEYTFVVRALAFDPTRRDSTYVDSMAEVRYIISNRPVIHGDTVLNYTIFTIDSLNVRESYTPANMYAGATVTVRKRASDDTLPLTVTPAYINSGDNAYTMRLRTPKNLRPGQYQDTVVITYQSAEPYVLKRVVVNLTVKAPTVEAPVFKPAAGTYYDSVEVVLSCATAGADIMYRLGEEGEFEPYTSGFKMKITDTTEIYAFGKKENWLNSDTVSALYRVRPVPDTVENVIFSPAYKDTLYEAPFYVTLSTPTEGAVIYWRTDTLSNYRLYVGAFMLPDSATVYAFASKEGNWVNSDTLSVFYRVDRGDFVPDTVDMPVFTPVWEGEVYNDSVCVEISCDTAGVTVYYSIDGAPYEEYTGCVKLTDTCVLTAFGYKEGLIRSATATAYYYVRDTRVQPRDTVQNVIFYPAENTDIIYVDSVMVTLSTPTAGAQIWYTRNGMLPYMQYTDGDQIKIVANTILSAYATLEGWITSDTLSSIYLVSGTQTLDTVKTPVFTPAGGSDTVFTDSVAVSITCATEGAVIYWAADTGEFTEYTAPVVLHKTTVLSAFAGSVGSMIRSLTATDTFYVEPGVVERDTQLPAPRFIAPYSGADSVVVNIVCDSASADIWYRVAPDGKFALYEGGFNVYKSATVYAFASWHGSQKRMLNSDTVHQDYNVLTDKVATPEFFNKSATYYDSVWVDISCATEGADIYYSINGGVEMRFAEAFWQKESCTIVARGIKEGWIPSDSAKVVYVIESSTISQVERPVFTPAAGEYTDSVVVRISCATEDAVIYYWFDGKEDERRLYEDSLLIRNSTFISAVAEKGGWRTSGRTDAEYIIVHLGLPSVSVPMIIPDQSTYDFDRDVYLDSVTIMITCSTEGATILYSTDGNRPSLAYTGPFVLHSSATVVAMGRMEGLNDSDPTEMSFTVVPTAEDADTVAAPVFNPAPGRYEDSVSVKLYCTTEGATILYALNGSSRWREYSGSIKVKETTTIRAMAKKDGNWFDSRIVEGTYVIGGEPVWEQVLAPEFDPEEGEYADSVVVTMSCATEGAVILYSRNGGEPTTVYTGPITLDRSTTVRAKAVKEGMLESKTVEAYYEITHQNFDLKAYPMPSDGNFTIELSEPATVEIINLQGVVIWRKELAEGMHEAHIRAAGYYVLRAVTKVGNKRAVETIVIL